MVCKKNCKKEFLNLYHFGNFLAANYQNPAAYNWEAYNREAYNQKLVKDLKSNNLIIWAVSSAAVIFINKELSLTFCIIG